MRYAVIATDVVVNVIELAEGANWTPPSGTFLRASDAADIGDGWNGVHFTRRVLWNDEKGNPVPDFEIDPENPPQPPAVIDTQ